MKRATTTIIFTLILISLNAQKIKYEASLESAQKIAFEVRKPIAILLTIKRTSQSIRDNSGLNNDSVGQKFNDYFINLRVDIEDTATSIAIVKKYKVYRFPAFIFLDSKGGLMFSDIAVLSSTKMLNDLADSAITNSKEKSLIDYDSAYKEGSKESSFIREYILRRQKAGLTDNADLIEEYVAGLNVSDLNKYDVVSFILKAGPYLDSNAYRLCYTNGQIVDSIYKTESLSARIAFNNAMISNTMTNAVANKNLKRAYAAANFTRKTWSKDYQEGQKSSQLKMLQYYHAVKDTTTYLQQAYCFYDQYYMRMTVDSLKKKDSLNYFEERRKSKDTTEIISKDLEKRQIYNYAPARRSYATELNNAAWSFYLMVKDNNDYLLRALLWSRRSIELLPKAAYYDTYAHLLYRLKMYNESESMQKTAVEMDKEEGEDMKTYKKEYEKIRKRVL